MAAPLTDAKAATLIGDTNQISSIDRLNLFHMKYNSLYLVTSISQELLRTYRCPLDVSYALNEVYNGIYSTHSLTPSLRTAMFTGATFEGDFPNTLYLIHIQTEKADLTNLGYGQGENLRILTINEANIRIIIQIKSKPKLYLTSVPRAVVAISRYTRRSMYYTDIDEDATVRFIRRAGDTSDRNLVGYNLKMAISHSDSEAMKKLVNLLT